MRVVYLLPLTLGCGVPLWNPAPPPLEPPTPAPASADAVTSIYLTRTACLGTCPHYHVVLRADGTATYVGAHHAPRWGTYSGQISPKAFRDLAAAAIRNGFFTHDTDLPAVLDAPGTAIRIMVADPTSRGKTISGSFEDYHYLWPLAAQIDSIADGLPWQQETQDTLPPTEATDAG